MARGEVNCMGSHSWSAAKATLGQYLSEGKMSVLVQWGPAKDPDISDHAKHDVPLIVDYAHNDMDREVLTLFNSSISIGRPLLAPPDVPRERVDALRRAFDETMADQDFSRRGQAAQHGYQAHGRYRAAETGGARCPDLAGNRRPGAGAA
jgi:hypothetical protein